MDPAIQAVFFLLAVLCFIAETVGWRPRTDQFKPQFGWLGLALFAFVFFWNAAEAGWS